MMSKEFKLELKVGIFIFMGLAVLCVIIFSITDFYVFQPGYNIKAVFGFVSGIAEAAPVRVAGVEVGEIKAIRIYEDEATRKTMIELTARIKSDVRIPEDSVVCINTLGLLGEKYLEILPGSPDAPRLADKAVIRGTDPILVENMTRDIQNMVNSSAAVVNDIRGGKGTVGKLLTEDEIYNDLRDLVRDIKAHPWKLLNKGSDGDKKGR